jgi:nicotinate-nucleotide adenylyltransferase
MTVRLEKNNQIQTLPFSPNQSQRKQIGILGGNFNPIHLAHLTLADQVGHALGLDKVYLMPESEPPHIDQKDTIAGIHRQKMIELAIQTNPLLEIETIELVRGGKSYTYETMKTLIEMNPDTDYYFIIGGDMVAYLPKWYNIEKLSQMIRFVGVKRSGYPTESPYPIIWIDVPLIDISSSFIRKKVKEGCSTNYFLTADVQKYIEKEGLYLD